MESYRGLAILATNLRSALDTAFVRRIRFIVNFPFPSIAERRTMWTKVFPAAVPQGELDWDRLASLPATGGMIHGIALNAAFMAAHLDRPVSMEMLLETARTEFRKQDLPVIETAFAWTSPEPKPEAVPA
jgi:ATP-dependent 26S proteasome regulatory subunit